jgi:hypothetical protein
MVNFNGESARIRRVIEMDWPTEGPKIAEQSFVAGNPTRMKEARGIPVSDVIARRLGASVGDQIIL